jgi:hypothetical protein
MATPAETRRAELQNGRTMKGAGVRIDGETPSRTPLHATHAGTKAWSYKSHQERCHIEGPDGPFTSLPKKIEVGEEFDLRFWGGERSFIEEEVYQVGVRGCYPILKIRARWHAICYRYLKIVTWLKKWGDRDFVKVAL